MKRRTGRRRKVREMRMKRGKSGRQRKRRSNSRKRQREGQQHVDKNPTCRW